VLALGSQASHPGKVNYQHCDFRFHGTTQSFLVHDVVIRQWSVVESKLSYTASVFRSRVESLIWPRMATLMRVVAFFGRDSCILQLVPIVDHL
jgi:hypothetical protein